MCFWKDSFWKVAARYSPYEKTVAVWKARKVLARGQHLLNPTEFGTNIFPSKELLWKKWEQEQRLFNDINERLLEVKNKLNMCTHPLPPAPNSVKTSLGLYLCIIFRKENFLSKLKAFVPSGSVYPSLSTTVKSRADQGFPRGQWLDSLLPVQGPWVNPGQGTRSTNAIVQPKKKCRTNLLGHGAQHRGHCPTTWGLRQ